MFCCLSWPGSMLSVISTILKISNESGLSALAAVIPSLYPAGMLILSLSKHIWPSISTLKLLSVWRILI